MYIRSRDSSFKLEVLGYEFPDSVDNDDLNWLTVKVECLDAGKKWGVSGCYLRTIELVELLEWLSCISEGEHCNNRLSFTEHEIAFEYNSDDAEFTVCLDFDCHPKGSQYSLDVDKEYRINFAGNDKVLQKLLQSIVLTIEKFPVRNLSH